MVMASMSRNAGGIFHSVSSLSRQLAVVCSVQIFSLRDDFSSTDEEAWRPLSPILFDHTGPRNLGYSPDLRRSITAAVTDIVHTSGIWMYPTFAAASSAQQKKFLLWFHPMVCLIRGR